MKYLATHFTGDAADIVYFGEHKRLYAPLNSNEITHLPLPGTRRGDS